MTQGKRPPFQLDRKPAARTPGGEQGASPETSPAPALQARLSRKDRLPFDTPKSQPLPASPSLEYEDLPVREPDDRPTGIVSLDAVRMPFSLPDDDLPEKEPDDRPTSVVSLADVPFSTDDEELPVREPDDRPTSVVSLETTDPFFSHDDEELPVREPDDRPTSVAPLETTDPFLSHDDDDGLPIKEPDDQPTGVVSLDASDQHPSRDDDGLPIREPDDQPTGVSLNDVPPPFSFEDAATSRGGIRNQDSSRRRDASVSTATSPSAAEPGKRAAAPRQALPLVSTRSDHPRAPDGPLHHRARPVEAVAAPRTPLARPSEERKKPSAAAVAGSPPSPKPRSPSAPSAAPAPRPPAPPVLVPARITREAPLADLRAQTDSVGRAAETPITAPEVSTSVGPHPAPPPSEPAVPLSRRRGAYSLTQAGMQRAAPPPPKTTTEPASAPVAPIDPAVQRRLAIVGVAAACILVPIFVYGFFVSTHRPSSEELWELYPSDERSGRATPPSYYSVEFEYLGSTPCMKNGSPDCLLYEYSYRSFTGRMAVRLNASGWERVDTAPEATPP